MTAEPNQTGGKGRKVLVVDDEDSVRELIELYLKKEGFEVIHARDGREALRLNGQHHPDLIVLDLMLPGLDGWEVAQTTMWSSPSARVSLWRGSRQCCAAAPRPPRRRRL